MNKKTPMNSSTIPPWEKDLRKFAKPDRKKAIIQIINTFVPYITCWILAVYLIKNEFSYWAVLPVTIVAAFFLVRIFIIFHDCCHGSFFASRRANRILGYISGTITFTPFESWRHSHNVHHATAGNLDRRGKGDVWTMTVDEYKAASKSKKRLYRIFRNPLVMFSIGPLILFLFAERFAEKDARKQERRSVYLTNLFLLALVLILSFTIGFGTYLMIQLPIIIIGGAIGVWLFYVQHQYESVYWERQGKWDPVKAALQGSSFYKLPKILHWLTGNIGYHHIHHLRPTIPNYNLPQSYNEINAMQAVKPLTLFSSLKSLKVRLWDEDHKLMVGFRNLKTR